MNKQEQKNAELASMAQSLGWFSNNKGLQVVAAILLVVIAISWLALGKIKKQIRADIRVQMAAVLHSSREAVNLWMDDRLDDGLHFVNRPDVRLLIKELLALPREKEALVTSVPLAKLRAIAKPWLDFHGDLGIFVIAPDGINIASMHDANMAEVNFFAGQGIHHDKLFQGMSQLVLPTPSDIAIGQKMAKGAPSLFIAVPVFDDDGSILAGFTIRIDPQRDFSRIIQLMGYLGNSDEAYAFNLDGLLISRIRFCEHMQGVGLVSPGQRATLNLTLRDPGGNLMEGFRPTTPRSQLPFTFAVGKGMAGESGFNIDGYRDYRGVPVVGAWFWDEEYDFGIVYEIDVEDVYRTYYLIRKTVITVLLVTSILFLGLSFVLVRRKRMTEVSNRRLGAEVRDRKLSEERFRALLESSPDGLLIVNQAGEITLANSQVEKLFGYGREELLGQHVEILIPERFTEGHDKKRQAFFTDPHVRPMGVGLDLYGHHKDGHEFAVEVGLSPARNKQDIVAIASIRDITKRKQVEDELKLHREHLEELVGERTRALLENEEKLKSITSSAQMAIIMIDNNGDVSFWNEAAERTFGWSATEVLGKDLHHIIVPEQYHEAHDKAFPTFQETGGGACIGQTQELVALRKNGQEFPVELALSAVKIQGKWHAIGLITDISERKQAEEELRGYVEEMERFSRLAVGREEEMIKLKVEINELLIKVGSEERYKVVS